MAIFNIPEAVYRLNYDTWARPVTVTPIVSQPAASAYEARGIIGTAETDLVSPEGAIISDSKLILDIMISEFPVPPRQRDIIDIPPHMGIAGGTFEVLDLIGDSTTGNAGGELTLVLREIVQAKP
jgi:hypothetical protein